MVCALVWGVSELVSDLVRGNQLLRSGKLEEAVAAYQKAIAHDQTFHWYHYKLGETLEKLGRLEEAVESYQRAFVLKPDQSDFRLGFVRAVHKAKGKGKTSEPKQISSVSLVEAHKINAEFLYEAKDYEGSLNSFQYYLSSQGTKGSFKLFQKARSAVGQVLKGETHKQFWAGCSDGMSHKFQACLELAKNSRFLEAKQQFALHARELFEQPQISENWIQAFQKICDSREQGHIFERSKIRTVQKILVSGMGWSGSSALYDYFREFKNIKLLKGEVRWLEGPLSLLKLYDEIGKATDYWLSFLEFFFGSLLGFKVMKSSGEYKLLGGARTFSLGADAKTYSENVNKLMGNASPLLAGKGDTLSNFKIFADDVANLLSGESGNHNCDMVLLDNCVHIANIRVLDCLKNTKLFCTFRDPRSNFVALKREHAGFIDDANKFIDSGRKQYGKLHSLVSEYQEKTQNTSSQVFKVQFEEFVLSETYRQELAQRAGLDLSTHKPHQHFKPWESKKNVYLHQTYENQEEIRAIEQALPEYCLTDLNS
ncbi:TPR repeat-containing protein [Limnospira maxima CS-328]|uniref:TPR repeat-containing protein n=1 Tax=Limnospira maxima CS-328 TaxID=513049 RepID=B5W7P8_LIMMA|nr:tetratricopeptide repeat protein [Limnospira maxima]EDZ92427.1 TPR repeat-containing protein [Limnospira maxima CS-328]